ncbi:hypothetical protein SC65A3_00381 [Psychrobacter sp. SC65A.3]|uniref:AAA family ATPase n=1 Tax=Psychrobacter sp. SC65A.3 TaxID=2983299 RepID=UPI0021D925E0|nr:AAA family ATPase [Psychrobacter sp. SC65A.3]WAI86931.1 hypothetical protein SC65A3_00381 [Psychrobacter sp. SC65A.3]
MGFYISGIEINGFWNRYTIKCKFNEDLNIIIGKNGSGKTTLMSILINILNVDLRSIAKNDFKKVIIRLSNGTLSRTIKVNKELLDNENNTYKVDYQLSNKKYTFYISDNYRNFIGRSMMNRGSNHQLLKQKVSEIIKLSSLSVYRLRNEDEKNLESEGEIKVVSSVDQRLYEIMQRLVSFQLELSNNATVVSDELKKNVLLSVLYDSSKIDSKYSIEFDKQSETEMLRKAFKQLNILDKATEKKIKIHVDSINDLMSKYNKTRENIELDNNESEHEVMLPQLLASFESIKKSRNVFKMSYKAEEEKKEIFSPVNDFIKLIEDFIENKKFKVDKNGLNVINKDNDEVDIYKLSSGEKQIIILLAEALLNKGKNNIYLADEPELSLHIDWQRKIIPSIKKLNPDSQIIVATHSPEIAASNRNKMISMKEIFHD